MVTNSKGAWRRSIDASSRLIIQPCFGVRVPHRRLPELRFLRESLLQAQPSTLSGFGICVVEPLVLFVSGAGTACRRPGGGERPRSCPSWRKSLARTCGNSNCSARLRKNAVQTKART